MRRQDFPVLMSKPTSAAASPADPIGDGLRADAVAYWMLDETSGTRVDATGNGHDLTPVNSPTSGTGIGGRTFAKLLRASKQYFVTDGDDFNSISGSFSVCGWAKPTSIDPDNSQDLFTVSELDNDENYSVFVPLFLANGSAWRLYFANDNFDSADAADVGQVQPDTWYFIAAWFDADGDALHLEVNGGNDNSAPRTAARPNRTNTSAYVGASAPSQLGEVPSLDGYIGLIGFWNRALTSTERAYLYNSGAGRSLY